MKTSILLTVCCLVGATVSVSAAPPATIPVFSDDFETGTLAKWTTTAASPLDPSTVQNIVPPSPAGQFSAYMNTSTDRMHHNLIADNGGAELSGAAVFTSWIYDATGPAARIFNEVRGYSGGTGLPNGGTTASGTLAQLLAIGKYNTVTLPGEVYAGTKYQGRVTFGANAGWFNLNAAGSPNRSTGWHRFDIQRLADGTTINFYVDGILSRTMTGATPESWDTVILGPGLGTTVGDAWIDGMVVGLVDTQPPVINCSPNFTVAATTPSGAVVNYTVTATDNSGTNVTINCVPASGSTFPIGTTTVNCTATDPSGNSNTCSFSVIVTPGTPPPAITDFFPREGGEGTLLTIIGGPFHGGSPDNHCAVMVGAGNRFIDIEVLTATPNQLVGRLGVIPPEFQGQPLQLMVGVGQGARAPVCPVERDVLVDPDNWIWRGDAAQSATAPGTFFAVPPGPGGTTPALMNFHSGAPMGGTLMILLDKDWGVGSRYCISTRVHAQGTGADTRIGPATFTGNGSRFDCARRICDILVKAFAAHPTRPLTVLCTVTTKGTAAKITLSLPGGQPIDGGNIDILQKAPPPVIAGPWDIENRGLWRTEVRKREIARWYRHYEWTSVSSIWFEKRAEGMWITKQALESFTSQTHCLYRFPDGRVWVIWRTFRAVDVRRFWVHHRFYWPGRVNPLIPLADPAGNRIAMTMDDVQITLPMTPQDPNPATPFNEAVMIVDENGVQHFQGEPGFEVMPDIAGNPNGFQLATTAQSTGLLPPAAQRIVDAPMPLMAGQANLQPGVIIQWLVDKNGNILVDGNQDGWPDPLLDPHVLGGQKHQGLIAPATGVAGTALPVDQGNSQLQLYCWELDPNGEVRGASPGQAVVGPPVDVNGDGLADGPAGAPIPMDPVVRELVVDPNGPREVRDPTAKPVELEVIEGAAPTDAQLAAMNANLGAQLPGFQPLQRPFTLCLSKIRVRRIWGVDRRYVMDLWRHHWEWTLRQHLTLQRGAYRVWLTKVAMSQFTSSHHHHHVGLPPSWSMYNLIDVRFFRVCYRVVVTAPNQVVLKIDQMHVVVPADPNDPNSPLMLLSTQGDENKLFQEVPPSVLAGLQPDPLPVGPDGVFVEPIDPVAGTLDIGMGGTGVILPRAQEARGMAPVMLNANSDAANQLNNNQLQLYCWMLNPNGTIATETYGDNPFNLITLAVTPTPALPAFDDGMGNAMASPTMFSTALSVVNNEVRLTPSTGGTAQLTWDGPGQLQSTDALLGNGPATVWVNEAGGDTNPVTVSGTTTGKRFYRVRR